MIGALGLDQFDNLPLWGQVLVAARLVRRRNLALPETAKLRGALIRDIVNEACDAIEACCIAGDGTKHVAKELDRAVKLREQRIAEAPTLGEAIYYAIDACRAAEAAYDFPVDGTVTSSATNAIAALNRDRNLSTIQLMTLIASDLDLVKFACEEGKVGKYDGLTRHVLGRMPPVHPLSLGEPVRSAEDEAR
jgi:hypothetical protein